jgi:glutamate-1-semialdehyde aminotransferase
MLGTPATWAALMSAGELVMTRQSAGVISRDVIASGTDAAMSVIRINRSCLSR